MERVAGKPRKPYPYTDVRWAERETWVNCVGCGRFIRHAGLFCIDCRKLDREAKNTCE